LFDFPRTDNVYDDLGTIASTNTLKTNTEQTFNDPNRATAVLPPIIALNQPKHRTEFQPRKYGCREHAFQASWFEKFPWLQYCEGFDVARCYICHQQHEKSALNSCRNQENAFIKTGYCNWKNAIENFRKHEKSLSYDCYYV
jgi:hypothetical protein